jgi:hypothetical protein
VEPTMLRAVKGGVAVAFREVQWAYKFAELTNFRNWALHRHSPQNNCWDPHL